MAVLQTFKRFARYFPAPIRRAWGLFIDTILETIQDAIDDAPATIPPYTGYVSDPTGIPFDEAPNVTLDYDDVTRTFSVSGSFVYLYEGTEFIHSGTTTVIHADATGLWHFYFNPAGVLVADDTVDFLELIRDNVYLANVYWNSNHAESVLRGDELHGTMDWNSHVLQHVFGTGTLYGSGLVIGDILADQDGSLDSHAQFSMSTGNFTDEDRYHDYAGSAAGATFNTWSKEGANGDWYIGARDTAPIVMSLGIPQINEFTGGVWTQTPVTNGNYYLAHIFMVNDWRTGTYKMVSIQGEAVYQNIAAARDGALVEIASITLEGLPAAEFLRVATIIYQYRNTYGNTWSSRIRTTDAGETYINWLNTQSSPGSAPSAHPNLTNRDDPNQHPDSAVDLSGTHTQNLALSTTVADAMQVLDDLDDGNVRLIGPHTGILAGDISLDDAMDSLDDLEDGDIPATGTWTGWLSGVTKTVKAALDHLDGLSRGVYMDNDKWISWRQVTGGGPYGWLGGIRVNASDEIEIGTPSGAHVAVRLDGDSYVDEGDLTVDGDVVADNVKTEFNTLSKIGTISDNVATTFVKLPIALNKAASISIYWEVEAATGSAVEFASGHVKYSFKRVAAGVSAGTVTEWGRDNTLIGGMTVAFAQTTAATEGRGAITANSSLVAPTITLRVWAVGGGELQPNWSNF